MSTNLYGGPANAIESQPALPGAAPPDAQPQTLQDHLQAALQIMAQDRQFSPDEQQAVMAFMQGVQQLAAGKGTMGQPPAGTPQNPFGAQPGGPPQNSPVPYGQVDGSEPKPGFTQPFTGQM